MKIITLTLNPAFDLHCFVKNFEPYHENLADISSLEAGGKGVNISRALGSLGVENKALVVLGKENGDAFRQALAKNGTDSIFIELEGRIRENITLHTENSPETRISFRGFSADASLLHRVEASLSGNVDSDTVVTFTGSLPDGVSVEDAKNMLKGLKAEGTKIVIDSRSFKLDDIKELYPWLIKPNEEEIQMYSRVKVTDLESAAIAAAELQKSCAENVIISLGDKGAVLACKEGSFTSTAPKIKALSTVGAGDSMIAGFIAATQTHRPPLDTLKFAVSCGSAACLTEGTTPPDKNTVTSLMHQLETQ